MHRLILTVFLLLIAVGANADSFWLLGSYSDRESALEEAQRISAETGIEIFLHSGGERYRLLSSVLADEKERQAMKDRLSRTGITNTFVLNYGEKKPELELVFVEASEVEIDDAEMAALDAELDMDDDLDEADLAEIDAMLSEYDEEDLLDDDMLGPSVNYVVAASFTLEERADALSVSINAGAHDVMVKSTMVGGTRYYRVLVGPVSEDEEAVVKRQLVEQGHEGVWVLRGVKVPSSSQSLDIGVPPKGFRVPSRQQMPQRNTRKTYPGEDSDYNLARLKKKLISA
ncbi:MAG: SPOR domain-containing protein [Gammaproteobacteria bacterium]|jgi:hypothetical protein|nr:SPOR domain-containing protein [Gammaproteobacteria bacterium]MBT4493062.1 SPOR domain-containing protein [Gammaproteobacteria bacterium]MBT7371684.1 SPOR domain-containing protein [Gammaproteobacteria bacterium]